MALLRPEQPQAQPPQQAQYPQQNANQQTPNQQPQSGQPKQEMDPQERYERVATMALNYVYSEQGVQMVSEGLRAGGGDITQNAGNVVAQILMRLIVSVRTSGGSIPPKIMLQVGMEITLAVMEIAEADGELPNMEGDGLDKAFYVAVDTVGKTLPKNVLSDQERSEVVQTLQSVQQMQASGQNQPQSPQNQQLPQPQQSNMQGVQ